MSDPSAAQFTDGTLRRRYHHTEPLRNVGPDWLYAGDDTDPRVTYNGERVTYGDAYVSYDTRLHAGPDPLHAGAHIRVGVADGPLRRDR